MMNTMHSNGGSRVILALAGLFGATGVVAGAFSAHGLSAFAEPRLVEIFKTGAHYHLIHAVALLALASRTGPWATFSALAFTAGILVFSGSLYLRVLTDIAGFGAITPWGGLAFILGWLSLILAAWRQR
ncbi:MAG TPA: DUF423 domain-containing protein [Burkholderiaceae bacterium]|nr:DUF423 domain-containing protein [Burkholderiaceae bacterium]